MNQLVVNSEHFTSSTVLKTTVPVPNLDATPTKQAPAVARRMAIWPMIMIGIGGIATIAWNGFLVWHTARMVIGWVAGEI